jgi:hypothetical protein
VVEEVGAHRDEHGGGRVGIGHERGEAREEPAARLLVRRQREQLLELVDDEEQLAARRKDPLHDAADPELVLCELLDEIVRPIDRDPEERSGELLVGVRAGEHVGDEQSRGPRQRAAAERRNEAGPDNGGLPDPGGADHSDQASIANGTHELVDEGSPAVENGSVRFVECPQALVRVFSRCVRLGRPTRLPHRGDERGDEAIDRRVALVGIRGGRARDDLVERGGQLGPRCTHGRQRPIHGQPLTGQQLERQESESVDIRL